MTNMFSNLFGQSHSDDDESEEQSLPEFLERRLHVMEKRMAALESKVKALEARQIEEEKLTVSKAEKKSGTCNATTALDNILPSEPVAITQEKPRAACCFLAAPNPDGTFGNVSDVEQIGKSIYQLTTHDGVSGHFIMLDTHDAIATAMISVSQFIKPVCKVVGTTSSLPRHIVTDEEGVASNEGGVWRVTRKAVVRFE